MTLAAAAGLYYNAPEVLEFISRHQPDLTEVTETINDVIERIGEAPLVRMAILGGKAVAGTAHIIGSIMGPILGFIGKGLDYLIFARLSQLTEGPDVEPFTIAGPFLGFVGTHILSWLTLATTVVKGARTAKGLAIDTVDAIKQFPSRAIDWTDNKLRETGQGIQNYLGTQVENAANATGRGIKNAAFATGRGLLKVPGAAYRGIKSLF
jgi:hypothetical protein